MLYCIYCTSVFQVLLVERFHVFQSTVSTMSTINPRCAFLVYRVLLRRASTRWDAYIKTLSKGMWVILAQDFLFSIFYLSSRIF